MGQAAMRDKARGAAGTFWPALWAGLWAVESRRAILWLPVCLGAGIWVYFALPEEPAPGWAALALLPLAALLSGAAWRGGWAGVALALALGAAATGFSVALMHTHRLAAPVLAAPLAETVEGRILGLDRSGSGAPRLLLDRVRVYGLEAGATPARIRLSIIEADPDALPPVGHRLRVHARIFPPGGPAEPGGFDFRRMAYFERLGAVGYVRGAAVLDLGADPASGLADRALIRLAGLRADLSAALRAALPGPEGAFAAAIVVGDRSAIEDGDAEALRAANLAHLLAISGLHMGMLCGIVFGVVRLGLAALPWLALSVSTKKAAALAALLAGLGYLALSGATVATQRAFVMVAVALGAVLIDRPALTLRALAVAAVAILLLRPVSLLEVGFQMSFAATTALVAAFESLRLPRSSAPPWTPWHWPRLLALYAAGVLATSLIAGLATAPYAAAAFNRAAPWGLAANLAAVPVMGLVIAPAAVLAGLLVPLGLAAPALQAMGLGIGWVLAVAHAVAAWPGSVRPVPVPPEGALALITLGGLWLAIWRTRLRVLGAVPMALGLVLWSDPPPRPAVLIGPGARLVGVMGPKGRVIDHARAQGFVAETWLRRDADLSDQETAAARPGLSRAGRAASAVLENGWRVEIRAGTGIDRPALAPLCRPRTLLVARHGPALDGPCLYLGAADLAAAGAVAAYPEDEGLRLKAADAGASRPWSAR